MKQHVIERAPEEKSVNILQCNWLLYFTGLCILGAITFEGTLQLSYDTHDRDYMTDSAAGGIGHMFSAEKIMPGRPFFEFLLWIQYQLWQDDIQLFHLTGVILHILASCFLAVILNQRNIALPICFTAGFLFLINTAQFRAIHWMSAHCYPLALLCCFTAMYCFYRWLQSGHFQYAALTYLSVIAGLLSHLSTIVLFPLLLLDTRHFGSSKKAILFLSSLGFSAILCMIFVTNYYERAPQVGQAVIISTEWSFTDPFVAFIFLMGRLVTTMHWLLFPLYKVHVWDYISGLIATFAALVLLTHYRSTRNLYGLLWLLGGLAPFLLVNVDHIQSIPSGPSRYLYMAGVGGAILLSSGIYNGMLLISSRLPSKDGIVYSTVSYTALLFSLAISSVYYHNQAEVVSLYASGRNELATGHRESGVSQFRRVIQRDNTLVDSKDTYERLLLPLMRVNIDIATYISGEGSEHHPDSEFLKLGRDVTRSLRTSGKEQKEIIKSIAQVGKDENSRKAIKMLYSNAIALQMENGNLPAASMISDIRLQSIPDDSEVLWDSAIIYAKLTRFDAARKQLEKILTSGAPEIKVLTLLARICIHQNDPTSAETHINQLLEIDPSNSEALSLKESLDQNTQPKQ